MTNDDVILLPKTFKLASIVALIGALAIFALSALWAKEVMFYGGYLHAKIIAVFIVLAAIAFIAYCIVIFKGSRAGAFKSGAVNYLEMSAYCLWMLTAVISAVMLVQLVVSGGQDWEDALRDMFIPTLFLLALFSISLFYVMRKRQSIPVSSFEASPNKLSPRWYIALCLTLILLLYGLIGLYFLFFNEGGPKREKIYLASALVIGLGFIAYLFSLRSAVNEGEISTRTPTILEIFAYAVIGLSLFEGLRKLPYILMNLGDHYRWTFGNRKDFIQFVRFIMPVLCIGLAYVTLWLVRTRLKLSRASKS